MTDTPELRFKGAASTWGPGKVHQAIWITSLSRWGAACQSLNPDKHGADAWPGKTLPQTRKYELSCKRCLQQHYTEAATLPVKVPDQWAAWEPMVKALQEAWIKYGPDSWTWYGTEDWARSAVRKYAKDNAVPTKPEDLEYEAHDLMYRAAPLRPAR
jgi:hypothetical protein